MRGIIRRSRNADATQDGEEGYKAEDVLADVEGCETIRNMATNMAFMIKSIKAGAEQFGKPDVRHTQFMNFIR